MIESDDHLAVRPHFKIVRQRDGRFHWELINPHATTAARSMGTVATEDEAAANAEYAQRLIAGRRSSVLDDDPRVASEPLSTAR